MTVDILLMAVPLFLALIIIELIIDWRRKTGYYRLNDAYSSLVLGMVSRTSQLLFYVSGLTLAMAFIDGWQLLTFSPDNPWHWALAFVLYDFTYYWKHRFGHTYNILWAGHLVHHQSEDFNLTTALRQSSTGVFDWIFSIPMLLLGIPIEMLVTSAAFNLIYQFWVHTQLIDKCGWMERWFVTPSHHRVHHGQNDLYIDKNHGGVFIIWDKLFGTFQAELESEPVIYGVSRASNTFDPITANLQFWGWMLKDAWYAKSWWDKLTLWFRPTGWRPRDVEALFPVAKRNLAEFSKFDPKVDVATQRYGFLQLIMAIPVMVYYVLHFPGLEVTLVLLGFVAITMPLVTTGRMLEGKSRKPELVRLVLMWPLIALCLSLMATSSMLVFGGYLLVNSFVYFLCFGLYRDVHSPEAHSDESVA
ncbi:MAG: hypothetical protein GJ680_10885 [Alteromonadaceae bacterium]|nr:hypothetical protein [Alteromonadaceae bacterium]